MLIKVEPSDYRNGIKITLIRERKTWCLSKQEAYYLLAELLNWTENNFADMIEQGKKVLSNGSISFSNER